MKSNRILKGICFLSLLSFVAFRGVEASYQQKGSSVQSSEQRPAKTVSQSSYSEANRLWEEKSFRMSSIEFQNILDQGDLNKEELREVQFKLADSLWRAKATQQYELAVKLLTTLIEDDNHDRWWAEANESLGEHLTLVNRWSHIQKIKLYFENARAYWAGSKDIELARERFIKVTFTLADLIKQNWGWGGQVEISALTKSGKRALKEGSNIGGVYVLYEEILDIVKTDEDKAHVYFSMGMSYMNYFHANQREEKTIKYFTKVMKEFPLSEWGDDAHYNLAQFYMNKQDFIEAKKVYQKYLASYKKGSSPWVDQAQRNLKDIISPKINISNGYTYLPGSEIQMSMSWRNLSGAKFGVYKLDMNDALSLDLTLSRTDYGRGIENYQSLIKRIVEKGIYRSMDPVLSWHTSLKNEGKHIWYNQNIGLAELQSEEGEDKFDIKKGVLAPGAYLVLVRANGVEAYDLINVTDIGLVTKIGGHNALVYAYDGLTGEPRGEADVKYHYRYYDEKGHWIWEEGQGFTDNKGLLNIPLKVSSNKNYNNQHTMFSVVKSGDMQAFSQSDYYSYNQNQPWWIYAFADRPTYRPNEKVSFKATLRQYDESGFHTPAGVMVKAIIKNPRGEKVLEKTFRLNEFGSFNGDMVLDEKATLGQYIIMIQSQDGNTNLGQSVLFGLEEYKLPEFLVDIKPKSQADQKYSTYRLGDVIDVELNASYYFGGAVANADVEYRIYQSPYYHYYAAPRKYSWYYEGSRPNRYNNGGQLVKTEKIKTDEHGHAVFQFETPEGTNQDLVYRVEARVVDQSRREIVANSEIKVTRQAFYAYLKPQQNLYGPGDKAKVDIKIMTANNEPVSVDGKISVSRSWWTGHSGKNQNTGNYSQDNLLTKFVKTNAAGEAVFEFEPEQEGYYQIAFTSFDDKGLEITANVPVYICSKQSTNVGFQYNGLQVIAEKDTYSVGEMAQFMIVANKPNTWVLLSSESDEIFDYQMVHLEGTVKLVEFPITENLIPNVFIQSLSVENYQLKMHTLPLVVPPDDKFLNVKITSDKEVYHPQEKGLFSVEVTDKNGQPVRGEVTLGLVDASVYYIQNELAQDIRQFFYGRKKYRQVKTQSSFNQKQYKKLVRDENGQLLTEDVLKQLRRNKDPKEKNKEFGSRKNQIGSASASIQSFEDKDMVKAVGGRMRSEFRRDSLDNLAQSPSRMEEGESLAKRVSDKKEIGADDFAEASQTELQDATVRNDFRSTVVWQPTLITDENGKAQVSVTFPDSLTTWRATVRSMTKDTSVGTLTYETKTTKDVIVRLQAPRFFTERDEIVLSANVHNYTKQEQKVKVTLKTDKDQFQLKDEAIVWVTVPEGGEKRVDWKVIALKEGQADITVMAQTSVDSDAVKRSYPIIPHGIEKFIAQSLASKVKGNELVQSLTFDIPSQRIPESTQLELNLSPSLAGAMLDALPYLAEFPYGCVEQTMSRFLPAIIVKKTLKDLGLTSQEINAYMSDVLGGSNDPVHPERKTTVTLGQLDAMTTAGIKRLVDFQHADGGWGWWKEGNTDHYMTAYVVWGLSLAERSGVKVSRNVINRGVNYLQKVLVEHENQPDMMAWILHALASAGSSSEFETKHSDRLWDMREKLNPYTRALFALSEHYRRSPQRAEILARNIANEMIEDKDNGTIHWGKSGVHYRWSEGGVEATSFSIKALVNILPDSPMIEPAVKWMALNRRGARWKNTRDTAIAILGLADYLRNTRELNPELQYQIKVNGVVSQEGQLNRSNVFSFNRFISLPNSKLKDGKNTVEVFVKGEGSLYVSGYLKYFTLEENITPAGNEIFVSRKYYVEDVQETLLNGFVQDWRLLKEGDSVQSGDRIRVEIFLDAKNHYEYLVSEDYKPAGLETVSLVSGSARAVMLDHKGKESGQSTHIYQEFRDQKAAFFIDKLKQGQHKITYELRAEVPGTFHGMPNQTHAMYVPEIRSNSSEMVITVGDRE